MNYVLIPEECQFVYIAVEQKRRADENKGRRWSKAPLQGNFGQCRKPEGLREYSHSGFLFIMKTHQSFELPQENGCI